MDIDPDEGWEIEFADGTVSPLLPSPQLVEAAQLRHTEEDNQRGHMTPRPVIVLGPDVPDDLPRFMVVGDATFYVGDHHDIPRDRIVAVIDTDPDVVMAATGRGVDGIIWDTPDNRKFSWHFRATRADIVAGLERRLTEWKGRRTQ